MLYVNHLQGKAEMSITDSPNLGGIAVPSPASATAMPPGILVRCEPCFGSSFGLDNNLDLCRSLLRTPISRFKEGATEVSQSSFGPCGSGLANSLAPWPGVYGLD